MKTLVEEEKDFERLFDKKGNFVSGREVYMCDIIHVEIIPSVVKLWKNDVIGFSPCISVLSALGRMVLVEHQEVI